MKKALLALLFLPLLTMGCGDDGPEIEPENPGTENPGNGNTGNDEPDEPDEPSAPILEVDFPDEVVFDNQAHNYEVSVRGNIDDWTVTSTEDWCRTVPGPYGFDLILDDIYDESHTYRIMPRKATVTVSAAGKTWRTISVVQEAVTNIFVSYYNIKMPPAGGVTELPVETNCYSWYVDDLGNKPDWVTVTRVDQTTVRIETKARAAGETEPRTARFQLRATSNSCSTTIGIVDDDARIDSEEFHYGEGGDWD